MLGAIVSGAKVLLGLGTSKGVDNVMSVASGIGSFIDEQQYTPEERAKIHADVTIPAMQKFMESTADENTERSKTRRDLALWIIRNWFMMLWVAIVAYGAELLIEMQTGVESQHALSAFVLGVATIAQLLYLVLGVGAFFFGAHINRDMPWARDKKSS